MTIPNYISLLRILLVPVFVSMVVYYVNREAEVYRYLAIIVFSIAALSDAVDGYLARRLKQESRLGSILDPLADKLLLVGGFVVLSLDHRPILPAIPIWLSTLVISRDVILPLGTLLISFNGQTPRILARSLGKTATVAQMATILWALLKWPSTGMTYCVAIAGILTLLSGVQYVADGVRQLSSDPGSETDDGRAGT